LLVAKPTTTTKRALISGAPQRDTICQTHPRLGCLDLTFHPAHASSMHRETQKTG